MKEGTGGLSSPVAKRLTGFGAELVHLVCRPGASKNTVHVPMPGAGGQRSQGCAGGVFGMYMGRAENKFQGTEELKSPPSPHKGVERLP